MLHHLCVVLQHLWNITMVQLVSLMYRDQQQGTIRKLINEWLESSLPESSEDDENNPMSSSSSSSVSSDVHVGVYIAISFVILLLKGYVWLVLYLFYFLKSISLN